MDQRLTEILKELRSHLEALYGNRLVKTVVYGSQARGDARPWSDIDVAVVLKGPGLVPLAVAGSGCLLHLQERLAQLLLFLRADHCHHHKEPGGNVLPGLINVAVQLLFFG